MVTKTSCVMLAGQSKHTIGEQKKQLLINAKRDAVSEIFGELITSFSQVNDFELANDQVVSSSIGYVRITGDPVFTNGENFGEGCVTIHAFATEQDKAKFRPIPLSNKQCASDSSLTVKKIKQYTEDQVILSALLNYNRKLESFAKERLLPLVHKVKFNESGFIPGTETYCAKFEGVIYPAQIEAMTIGK